MHTARHRESILFLAVALAPAGLFGCRDASVPTARGSHSLAADTQDRLSLIAATVAALRPTDLAAVTPPSNQPGCTPGSRSIVRTEWGLTRASACNEATMMVGAASPHGAYQAAACDCVCFNGDFGCFCKTVGHPCSDGDIHLDCDYDAYCEPPHDNPLVCPDCADCPP